MKNQSLLFLFLLSTFLFSCDNPKPLERKENAAPVTESMESKTLIPSHDGGVDFWVDNGCTREIPKPTISVAKRPNNYNWKLDKQQGYGKETMYLDNGYSFDITSKGCQSIWVTHSSFMPAEELDVRDAKAVSAKVIELIEITSEFSTSPIDIKGKVQALKQAIEQIGPFNIGQELVLNDGEVKETFGIDKLDTNGEKVFIQYYFTKGPV